MPISIGFLRQFAATPVTGPARKLTYAARFRHRMILLTFGAWLTRRFRFAFDRHNSATDVSSSTPESRRRLAAAANLAGKGEGNGGNAEGRRAC
jgi:hypothetical protein